MFIKINRYLEYSDSKLSQHHPERMEEERRHKTYLQKLKASRRLNAYVEISRGK